MHLIYIFEHCNTFHVCDVWIKNTGQLPGIWSSRRASKRLVVAISRWCGCTSPSNSPSRLIFSASFSYFFFIFNIPRYTLPDFPSVFIKISPLASLPLLFSCHFSLPDFLAIFILLLSSQQQLQVHAWTRTITAIRRTAVRETRLLPSWLDPS